MTTCGLTLGFVIYDWWASEEALVKEATEMGMRVLKMCGEYILVPDGELVVCLTGDSTERWNWERITRSPEKAQERDLKKD